MIEVNVGEKGLKITPKEIFDLLQRLSSILNEDKKSICLALSLINQNIQDWENEIISFVINQMTIQMTQRQGPPKKQEHIHANFKTTHKPKREKAATQSIYILKNIEKQYDSGKLKKLVQKLNIDSVQQIQYLINGEQKSGDLDWIRNNAST